MLGHGPLGRSALGELPADLQANAVAPGALLPLRLTFIAGQATGEGLFPPIVIGGFARATRRDGRAPGALILLDVSLLPGRVTATVNAAARGTVLRFRAGIVAAGAATGFDGIAHDNDLLLLDAA